jgi:hypothetical protein
MAEILLVYEVKMMRPNKKIQPTPKSDASLCFLVRLILTLAKAFE